MHPVLQQDVCNACAGMITAKYLKLVLYHVRQSCSSLFIVVALRVRVVFSHLAL